MDDDPGLIEMFERDAMQVVQKVVEIQVRAGFPLEKALRDAALVVEIVKGAQKAGPIDLATFLRSAARRL